MVGGNGKSIRIGVDVGAIDPSQQYTPTRGVLAHHKTPTTTDVTAGIEKAVKNVLSESELPPGRIVSVTVGTTHFINAVVEQDARRLRRVAIIRISKSFLREVHPFSEFPPGLTSIIKGYVGYVDGGLHIDGSEEAPIDEQQVVERCREIKGHGLSAVVVVGTFSPIDEHFRQENRVRDIVLQEMPYADVTASHECANIGLMERENAAILNAAILRYARRTVKGFRRAMQALRLTCPLFLTQNDGTLLDSASAANIPIRTFSSGATNSMRGAAYLTGHDLAQSSAIVVDIGGTTADVGVLLPSGLPRQASAYVTVAGVRVNYSMPSLHSIGLGGGSIVREKSGKVTVGPDSVGHYLARDALVFGGRITTASDIAVAAGKAQMGDAEQILHLDRAFIEQAQLRIKTLLEGAIDAIKTSPEPLPVLLVGGGAVLAPSLLKGASDLKLPPFHDVANAVGAAISKVGGIVDIIQSVADQSQNQAIERAKSMARHRALDAGAIRESIVIAEVESYPVTYVANQLRTVVKAVGELDINSEPASLNDLEEDDGCDESEAAKNMSVKVIDEPLVDPLSYRPSIVRNWETDVLEWHITETDLDFLADASRIQMRDMIRAGYKMKVIDASSLKPDAHIYWGGHMGSPATSTERLQSLETVHAFNALLEYRGESTFDAVMGLEVGGANGLEPFLVGSSRFFDRPVIDTDWMGRAYPTYWQTTLAVHAPGELVPCAIDSGDGKTIIMTKASNDEIVDRALRASCSEMGCRVGMAANPTTADKVQKYGVLGTVSLSWRIGRCIAQAEVTNTLSTVAEQIIDEVGGEKSGKHTDDDGTWSIVASVPDLICVIDTGSGKNLGVPEFKYGYRVAVLGITCSPRWSDTEAGLRIGGPGAFGYHDILYRPLGQYVEPRSVIEEFAPS
ncbi:hypothetical protein BST61_g7385 [Cercospora zeina]